jgi:putative membrane protein
MLREPATDASPAASEKFLGALTSGALFEREAGALALERAEKKEVHAFAQRSKEQGQITLAALEAIASKRNEQVAQPRLSEEHRQRLNQLQRLRGPDFTTRYVLDMVALHQKQREDLRSYSRQGSDVEYQRLATQLLPRVEDNLSAAQRLEGTR